MHKEGDLIFKILGQMTNLAEVTLDCHQQYWPYASTEFIGGSFDFSQAGFMLSSTRGVNRVIHAFGLLCGMKGLKKVSLILEGESTAENVLRAVVRMSYDDLLKRSIESCNMLLNTFGKLEINSPYKLMSSDQTDPRLPLASWSMKYPSMAMIGYRHCPECAIYVPSGHAFRPDMAWFWEAETGAYLKEITMEDLATIPTLK